VRNLREDETEILDKADAITGQASEIRKLIEQGALNFMKTIMVLLMAAAITVSASDTNKTLAKVVALATPDNAGSWIDSINFAPVGAIKTEHLDGPSQWGVGLDIGANINPFVGFHVVNLSFEGPGQSTVLVKDKSGKKTKASRQVGEDPWGGLLVDETDLQVDAKISRFSNESFSLHLVSGGQYDWNDQDYGVNAGLRLVLDFNKNVGASVGYSIRTWFKGETRVDSLATASINFSF